MYDEQKTLELLDYALKSAGVATDKYWIGKLANLNDGEDKLVLEQTASAVWRVYYLERGKECRSATFTHGNDAIKFFFWKLTDQPSLWDYRERWETLDKAL